MTYAIRGIYRIVEATMGGLRLSCGMRTVAEARNTPEGIASLRRAAEADADLELDWEGGTSWNHTLPPFRDQRVLWQATAECRTLVA